MNRQRERGAARLKAVFWILVLVAAVYVCVKTLPAYFANYQLQDRMITEARFATVNRRSDEELRDIIYSEIQEQQIPARREDIRIENTRRGVNISVEYTVTVDLGVYELKLHFNPSADNRSIL